MGDKSLGLVVVTDSLDSENPAYTAVQNFIRLYESEADQFSIIGPSNIELENKNNIKKVNMNRRDATGLISTIATYFILQIKISSHIYKMSNKYDAIFFHLGGNLLIFPVIVSRITNTRSIIIITTDSIEKTFYGKNTENLYTNLITKAVKKTESLTCILADKTVLLSESMKRPANIGPFSPDTTVANLNYVDSSMSKSRTIDNRDFDLIYVGRLIKIKQPQKIIKSVSILNKKRNIKIKAKIVGDGPMKQKLIEMSKKEDIEENITFTGWMDHKHIPNHFNTSCLFILPSQVEGVPKTILEAMACGTIPVATPVGGIPDIISNEDNGFIIENTEPKKLSNTISNILERNDLEIISDTAQKHVMNNYSFDKTRNKYTEILD